MKTILIILVATLLSATISPVAANQVVGNIVSIQTNQVNEQMINLLTSTPYNSTAYILVTIAPTPTATELDNIAECSTSSTLDIKNRLLLDPETEMGKIMLIQLLQAKAMQTQVVMGGGDQTGIGGECIDQLNSGRYWPKIQWLRIE